MRGFVESVDVEPVRSFLAADAAAGTVEILVHDADALSVEGAIAVIAGQEYAVDSVAASESEDVPDVVILDQPVVEDVEEGEPVEILPLVEYTIATVALDGDLGVVAAVVGQDLQGNMALRPGAFEGAERPAVEVELQGDEHVVTAVDGRGAADGSYIDPDTVPPPTPVAPEVSPAVTVTGTSESLVVEAESVHPSVLVEYHVSTDPDFTPTLGDTATRSGLPTRATVYVLTEQPSGAPLEAGTSYSVRTIAYNDAGAAEPGPVATGSLNPDALNQLILARLVAGFILTGRIQVGGIIIDANEGILIPQPDGRFIAFPADGSPADIAAHLMAYSLTVRDALTIQGIANLISAGAAVTVASGVSEPRRAPTVDRYWPSTTTPEDVFAPENSRGMVRAHNADGWYVPHSFFGGTLRFVSDAGEPTFVADFAANFQPDGGITRIGTSYYVLGVGINGGPRDGRWFVKRFDSSFNETGEWEYTTSWGVPRRPAIGTDGTNVVISRTATNPSGGARTIIITRHNAATGAYIDQPVSTAAPNQQLSAVTSVILLDGFYLTTGPRWVRAYSASTGARDTTREWVLAGAADLIGLGSDGTRLHHLDVQARLWTYSTLAADTTRSVDYSWFDSNPAGTGVHETDRGPARTFVQSARSWFRVQTDDPYNTGLPDDPNSVRIWVDGQRQTPDLAPGQTAALYEIPTTGTTTKAPSFAAAGTSSGLIESEEPVGWKAHGDGRLTQERDPVAPADVVNKAALDALGWYAVVNATDTGNMSTSDHREPAAVAFTSPGSSAVYELTINVDAQINTSGADNRTGLKINGTATGSQITTASSGTGRFGGARTYMVTGLAAGSHIAEIYTFSQAGTTRLYGATTLTVRRIA